MTKQEKTPQEIAAETFTGLDKLLEGLTKEECRYILLCYLDTVPQIQNGEPATFEDVARLMQNRLSDPDAMVTGFYSLIYYAMQAQENDVAQLVNAAFIAGIRSGKIQTVAQAQPYLDALGRILSLPGAAEGALAQIRCSLTTLETVLDHFFEDTLPKLKDAAPDAWEKAERDIDATQDIYNTYIDQIREHFQEAEDHAIDPYHMALTAKNAAASK